MTHGNTGRPPTSGAFRIGDGRKRGLKGKPATGGSFKKGAPRTEGQRTALIASLPRTFKNSAFQSKASRARIAYEHYEVSRLQADGYEVLWPASVCDRIVVKDGRVYFVEFKKPGQALRPAQQRVRDLAPEMYRVIETEFYASVVKQVDTTGSDPVGP